jgi:hypothetical protein
MYRTFSPTYQNFFTDVQRTKKNMYKTGEAGSPDINTGGAGTPAKPA